MSDVLGKIGGFFGKAAPAITGATAGFGLVGNILEAIQRSHVRGDLEAARERFANLTPEEFAGLVSRAQQPLSQDLLQSVGNLVQADVASRGLAEAPGIFAAEEAQALAPYKLEEQRLAMQQVFRQLGLPIEYAEAILGTIGGGSDITPQLLALLLRNAQKSPTATPSTYPPSPDEPGGGFDPGSIDWSNLLGSIGIG